MNVLKLILLPTLFLMVFNCSKIEEKTWVAKVGQTIITEQEYEARLNFSAFLSDIKNENKIKKIVLSSLVAEKLLAEEALNNNYQNDILNKLVNQNHKELMIEYLRADSVDKQVHISEQDVLTEYNRARKELSVKYITVADFETAVRLREEISGGTSFEDVANTYMMNMGWENETIPTKIIRRYPGQPKMEYALYKLKEGTTSEPIAAFGEYYLVKIDKIHIVQKSIDNSYAKKRLEIENEIREQKISKKYKSYYAQNISTRLGQPDWNIINTAIAIYSKSLFENKNTGLTKNNPLPENDTFHSDQKIASLKNKNVIEFKDKSWTLEELFQNLEIGPYLFDLENSEMLQKSFKRNIHLLLEHEAWFELAQDLKYNTDSRVITDHTMWRNYYYAKYYQESLEKEKGYFVNNTYSVDDYVSKISEEFEIALNPNSYKKARFIGQDIYLQKQHFANRRAVPPLLALGDHLSWQNKINTLLANTELN